MGLQEVEVQTLSNQRLGCFQILCVQVPCRYHPENWCNDGIRVKRAVETRPFQASGYGPGWPAQRGVWMQLKEKKVCGPRASRRKGRWY